MTSIVCTVSCCSSSLCSSSVRKFVSSAGGGFTSERICGIQMKTTVCILKTMYTVGFCLLGVALLLSFLLPVSFPFLLFSSFFFSVLPLHLSEFSTTFLLLCFYLFLFFCLGFSLRSQVADSVCEFRKRFYRSNAKKKMR